MPPRKEFLMKSVVVGRFQTPHLHQGHLLLLNTAARTGDLVILVGVSRFQGNFKNPLDYQTRELMLRSTFPNAQIFPIMDVPSNKEWSDNLDYFLTSLFPHDTFKLFHSRDSFKESYSGKLETVEVESLFDISATDIRNNIKVRNSEDFRSGVIFGAKNQYPRIFPTVDLCVKRGDEILLGRKHRRKQWCLPGGFLDPGDLSIEHAGSRELAEETNLLVDFSKFAYLASAKINDWRCKGDSIITTLLGVEYNEYMGEPIAGDDLEEVMWCLKSEVKNIISDNHKPLINFIERM